MPYAMGGIPIDQPRESHMGGCLAEDHSSLAGAAAKPKTYKSPDNKQEAFLSDRVNFWGRMK